MNKVFHNIDPLFAEDSRILILGSFPSVRSRETAFFYGHPYNRFWKVLAAVFDAAVPASIPEKKDLILRNQLALWDVIASCEIEGSADSSIRSVEVNDLSRIIDHAKIERIILNGRTAEKLFRRYLKAAYPLETITLPSTSPANAACSLEQLISAWKPYLR